MLKTLTVIMNRSENKFSMAYDLSLRKLVLGVAYWTKSGKRKGISKHIVFDNPKSLREAGEWMIEMSIEIKNETQ